MAESERDERLGTPQKHLPMCDKHRGLIDIFCEDCDEFICTDCAKTDHKDHNWVTIVKAASQRRRQLFGFLQSIKENKIPDIGRKIEMTAVKIKEIENQAHHEIEKVRKHFDDIISRLTKIKIRHEKSLRDNFIKRCELVNCLKTQYEDQRKNLVDTVKLMEENNCTMSDYNFTNHHREMSKLVSTADVDATIDGYLLRYTRRELRDEEIDSLMGQSFDLEDIHATETNSFQYNDKQVSIINAFSESESYIQFLKSEFIEYINKQGERKHKYNVTANELCVALNGDVYFTDYKKYTIARLSPSGSVSTVVSTRPLKPLGICQSLNGGLLVTLRDTESETSIINSRSRRLAWHLTLTGDVIREYEYEMDGQTRLFTLPVRIQQNGNSDICVVNRTSDTTGNVVILTSLGRLRYAYYGQNLNEDFFPCDVVCDSRCNILVTDLYNHRVHLLSPDGEFLKFLMTENEVNLPTSLYLCASMVWVGNSKGKVKIFCL